MKNTFLYKSFQLILVFTLLFPLVAFATTWKSPINLTPAPEYNTQYENPKIAVNDSKNGLSIWRAFEGNQVSVLSSEVWGAPITISGIQFSSSYDVAINNAGEGVVVWTDNGAIKAARFSNGILLGIDVLSPTGGDSDVQVRINANGRAIVLWGSAVGDWGERTKISASILSNGKWSPLEVIIQSKNVTSPVRLAFNEAGNAIVLWESTVDDYWERRNISASVLSNEKWIPSEEIVQGKNVISSIRLAFSNAGNAIAVWSEFINGESFMYYSAYKNAWSEPAIFHEGGATSPNICLDNSGDGLAIWNKYDNGEDYIVAAQYSLTNGWSSPEIISKDPNAFTSTVAMNPLGNAVVIWCAGEHYDHKIISRRYINKTWLTPEIIASRRNFSRITMNINNNNQAVVVWEENLKINTVTLSDSKWSLPQIISSSKIKCHLNPTLAMNNAGDVYVIWLASKTFSQSKQIVQVRKGTLPKVND